MFGHKVVILREKVTKVDVLRQEVGALYQKLLFVFDICHFMTIITGQNVSVRRHFYNIRWSRFGASDDVRVLGFSQTDDEVLMSETWWRFQGQKDWSDLQRSDEGLRDRRTDLIFRDVDKRPDRPGVWTSPHQLVCPGRLEASRSVRPSPSVTFAISRRFLIRLLGPRGISDLRVFSQDVRANTEVLVLDESKQAGPDIWSTIYTLAGAARRWWDHLRSSGSF